MNLVSIKPYLVKGYGLLITAGTVLQHLLLAVVRAYWGWQLFITGKAKLTDIPWVTSFFTELGIPFPTANAWFVSSLECFGGLLLLVGLCSRPIALMMTVNMLVAYIAVEDDRAKLLGIFSNPEPFFAATPYLFLQASLLIVAFGPGVASIDAFLKRRYFSKKGEGSAS